MENSNFFKDALNWGVQKSPTILTVVGIGGILAALWSCHRDTKRHELILDETIRQKALETNVPEEDVKLETAEMVKVVATAYWPTAVLATLSIACICASDYITGRRNAALAAAYALSERALTTFQQKTIEKLGEEKVKEIKDDIAGEQIASNPPSASNTIVIAGGAGKTLCFDPLSGRYFFSSMEDIRRAVNSLNEILFDEMFVSLNDWYGYLGLPDLSDITGNCLGWDINHNGSLKIDYSSKLILDPGPYEGEPCLVLNYRVEPYFYDLRCL